MHIGFAARPFAVLTCGLMLGVASPQATRAQTQAISSAPPQLFYRDWLSPPFKHASVGRGSTPVRALRTVESQRRATHDATLADATSNLFRHQTSTIRQGFTDHGGNGADASTPGSFEYKNFDTYALGVVAADAAKAPFPEYFSRAVWQKIGAQADAAWLLDRNGDTATALGFGAVLRDWGRLALFVHDQVAQGGADSCLARYLREATSTRIANDMTRIGQAHRGYGYQFWTDNWIARGPNFWMMGYGGQRVAIDPASGRVMVLVASVEDFMPEVYRLFNRWIN